jgi:hypothetical protein
LKKIVFLIAQASINHRDDTFFFFFFTKTALKFDENAKVKILEFALSVEYIWVTIKDM